MAILRRAEGVGEWSDVDREVEGATVDSRGLHRVVVLHPEPYVDRVRSEEVGLQAALILQIGVEELRAELSIDGIVHLVPSLQTVVGAQAQEVICDAVAMHAILLGIVDVQLALYLVGPLDTLGDVA